MKERFEGGMSGSPILNAKGVAIGAVSTEWLNPRLTAHLPGWLLEDLFAQPKAAAKRRP